MILLLFKLRKRHRAEFTLKEKDWKLLGFNRGQNFMRSKKRTIRASFVRDFFFLAVPLSSSSNLEFLNGSAIRNA